MGVSKREVPESETRQRVRQMLALGLSVRNIADALGISTQAVYQHQRKIRRSDAA